ncbi:MAG: 50S ribosomal protein L11 [Candidatus Coatesbacteria bacterium 4484_99]|uniref:Large ribosomal subunit protein uL11 n=1 Tax=Candidatus Coatesbacteria bacterium 4484_99 TaxID=1970774 RepID=A0A1W9S3D6_9BACT|nr:MAG: 50S ribosomal protein L11 [Candidatus Coatesbacteria bacterium 4484_99]RLC42558.1 MAG: 50S ribosomal protein L11 [Candidatus Coatesbacteria bacterium]RLC43426.1 MAG: 50S ribosomal protein L11 [Candidatus Coatesbacteria bacterium]RLC43903.1 MAG: 50S ribosomal protein L11 [Candidatus Coatesbacteria bacterium]
MAKKILGKIKLHIPAGQATLAPPVGPALGPWGINGMEFCKAFNKQTEDKEGLIIPVIITVYQDRSFDFVLKTPPASILLKRALNLAKASPEPKRQKVGSISRKKVEEIAKTKMEDLNTTDLESAVKIIEGTARSMGILVED